ncbi:hypothetical protein F0562_034599 [Nyssa sinensis]|uniref:Uncharacterized protein n=1 Tax=Nyssa sinensis TaxID=561372 RepID=A0A5J5AAP6_9ASTE|nr:hypothetical protein F0562_034599 [Nyssa sinensis]
MVNPERTEVSETYQQVRKAIQRHHSFQELLKGSLSNGVNFVIELQDLKTLQLVNELEESFQLNKKV